EAKNIRERLESDRAARSLLDGLQRVDQAIAASMAEAIRASAPTLDAAARTLVRSERGHRSGARFSYRLRLAALSTVAAAAAVLAIVINWPTPSVRPYRPSIRIAALYSATAENFVPDVVCDTPNKFREYTETVFGVPLVPSADAQVAMLGWNKLGYRSDDDAGGPAASVLLARGPAGEQIVAIFAQDDAVRIVDDVSPRDPLFVHEGEVAGLRIIELSPVATPFVSRQVRLSRD
ncbi:MAG: hypothetical protein AAGB48_13180, partial [Planctomycetota bacterium]